MASPDKALGSVSRPGDREYGVGQSMHAFWDLSGQPDKNERLVKLGQNVGQRGVAIFSFNASTRATTLVDGLHGNDVNSVAAMEPDNYVARLHSEGGRGADNVWAIRLITEHDNPSDEKGHRSTIWVDQCESQHWAWSMDAFWIVNLQVKIKDPEIQFNGASFLPMFFVGGQTGGGGGGTPGRRGARKRAPETVPGPIIPIRPPLPVEGGGPGGVGSTVAGPRFPAPTRGTLSQNVSKKGGYITDGKFIGQLWHIFSIPEPEKKSPTPPDTCAPFCKSEGSLRGDVAFHVDFDLAALSFCESEEDGSEHDEGDLIFGEHVVREELNDLPPDREHEEDDKSNQPILERRDLKGIWICVRVPSVDYHGYETPPKDQGG